MITDFSRCKLSGKYYTGAERKMGIQLSGEDYIIKFRKNSSYGFTYNHISEYLGSHIFEIAGLETQQTWLGRYKGEDVVVLKDFTSKSELFVPFNEVGDSSLDMDRETGKYTYADIMKLLNANRKLTCVSETIDCFWDMFIMDAFLGNFDRHGSNWGFLKKNNQYRLAPVFDNGSCLFPKLVTDEQCLEVMSSQMEMEKRILQFPSSQIRMNGKKSSYYEVIHSHEFPECDYALRRIYNRLDLREIFELIENTPGQSDCRIEFLKTMLQARWKRVLSDALEKR